MTFGYQDIKQLGRQMRCSTKDLLACSPNNDPFYAGVPWRAEAGEWFARLWERGEFKRGVAHLRRLFYFGVSLDPALLKPDGTPFVNTEDDWNFICIGSLSARYLKLIPADALVDRRNPEPLLWAPDYSGGPSKTWSAWPFRGGAPDVSSGGLWISDTKVEEIDRPSFGLDGFTAFQPYTIELWIEKSTMDDVIAPLARRLGFNFVTGVGEMTEIATHNAVARAIDARKPTHIIYLSDHDPAGRDMPVSVARKIEFKLRELELDDVTITLHPLALTPQQVESYKLPKIPTSKTDKRSTRFELLYGPGRVELDALEALHPGALARIVEDEVHRYLDPTLGSRVSAEQSKRYKELSPVVDAVLEQYEDEFGQLDDRYDEIVTDMNARFEELKRQVEPLFDQVANDAQPLLDEVARAAESLLERAVNEIGSKLPEGDQPGVPQARTKPVENPLFDSRRSYLDQLDHYRAWQGRDGAR